MMETHDAPYTYRNATEPTLVLRKYHLNRQMKHLLVVALVVIFVLALFVLQSQTRPALILVLVAHFYKPLRNTRRWAGTANIIDTDTRVDAYGQINICGESTGVNINAQLSTRGVQDGHVLRRAGGGPEHLPGLLVAADRDSLTIRTQDREARGLSTLSTTSFLAATGTASVSWLRLFNPIAWYLTLAHNHYLSPVPVLSCATEDESREQDTRQIALHISRNKCIYRFKPGSNITVSIDEDSFCQRSVDERNHLQRSLESTLSIINLLNLGIRFSYIRAEGKQRGFVELRYGSSATSDWSDGSTTWADTQFPRPGRRYTVNIYSTTFKSEFISVTTNILQHEFAHLLSLRHHPAVPAYKHEPRRVVFPSGDNDTESIMGSWTHPGDLFFRPRDIKYLKKFFKLKAGERIEGKEIVDVAVP